jgi:hypothetical protein
MVTIILFVTTLFFAIGIAREHAAREEAEALAAPGQRDATQISGALDHCVKDKYAAELDQQPFAARNPAGLLTCSAQVDLRTPDSVTS